MQSLTIENFSGVNLRDESTDLPKAPTCSLRRAENALLLPKGALARPPVYKRLWSLNNLKRYLPGLGVTAIDKTVCLLIRNEGRMMLAFYDAANEQSLGRIYVGKDPDHDFEGNPTLTAAGATIEVLWKGLSSQKRWDGATSGNIAFMGNGADPNLVFENNPPTIRRMADQVTPLPPVVSAIDPVLTTARNASLQAKNVTFQALEPAFSPLHDPPYRRDRGNFVSVSVVQSGYDYFSSSISGVGTLSDPFIYTVLCPQTLPTEAQLVNFVMRDPNARGIVAAFVSGDGTQIVRLFPPAKLSGGTAEFSPGDVFAGPHVAVAVTYVKKDAANFISETMHSQVVTCHQSEAFRAAITITKDSAAFAQQYTSIRIYVANMASGVFGLSPEYYDSFQLALEVPNESGTYIIAPSMLTESKLSTEARTPPPCSMFIFANNRIYMSGNSDLPMRVFFTKQLSAREPLPEGTGIYNFIDFRANTTGDKIVALGNYRGQAVAYTKKHAYALEGNSRFAVATGAVNSRVIITWTNGAQYFLGRDFNIYTLTQPVTDARSDLPDFNLPLPQIGDYLQQYADLTDTQFANGIVDSINKNWWLFLRAKTGNMQGFCINLETAQLTGPFDFPQFVSVGFFEEGDNRAVGMDIAGNLFSMDFSQHLTISERFDNSSAIAIRSGSEVIGPEMDGFGICKIGEDQYVSKAAVMRIQSGWLRNGEATKKFGLFECAWQVVQGSAGLVYIVAINDKGQSIVRSYGDVFGRQQPHKVLMRLSGSMIQFLFIVVVGDDKPFALRDITFGVEPLGQN